MDVSSISLSRQTLPLPPAPPHAPTPRSGNVNYGKFGREPRLGFIYSDSFGRELTCLSRIRDQLVLTCGANTTTETNSLTDQSQLYPAKTAASHRGD